MNWQKEAINDLRNYRQRKQSLENMAERRAALEDRFKSIRCVATDADPVQGGSSRMEDSLINNIVERDQSAFCRIRSPPMKPCVGRRKE